MPSHTSSSAMALQKFKLLSPPFSPFFCYSPLESGRNFRKSLFAPFCATLSHFCRLIWRSHEADPLISFPYLRRSRCRPRPPFNASVSVVLGGMHVQCLNKELKQTYFPARLLLTLRLGAYPWHLQKFNRAGWAKRWAQGLVNFAPAVAYYRARQKGFGQVW